MDGGIDAVAGADDFFKRGLVGYHDEGARTVFRHSSAGFRKVIHRFAPAYAAAGAVLAEYLVKNGLALTAVHISASEPHQEFPDFRLEYHYDGYQSDIKHCLHNVGHQLHIECRNYDSYHVE